MERVREFIHNCFIISVMVFCTTGTVLGLLDISRASQLFPNVVSLVENPVLLVAGAVAGIGLLISALGISVNDAVESPGGPLWRRLAGCGMSWLNLFLVAAFVALAVLELGPIGFVALLFSLAFGVAIFVRVSQWLEYKRHNTDNAHSSAVD